MEGPPCLQRDSRPVNMTKAYTIASDPREVIEALAQRFVVRRVGRSRRRVRFFDTFDWRVHRAHASLSATAPGSPPSAATLSLELPDNAVQGLLAADQAVGFVWGLPPGPLRQALAPIVEMRRLLELAALDVHDESLAILNDDDKTVVRVRIAEPVASRPGDAGAALAMPPRCAVEPVRGYREAQREVEQFLEFELGLRRCEQSLFVSAAEAVGRTPGDYSAKLAVPLDPGMRAEEATRRILSRLLDTMLANEAGVREDIDSEFLHDFRVAVRRTRSALAQIKRTFPRRELEHFKKEFKWLGGVTGPVRDLDVHLLKMEDYRQDLPPQVRAHLDPLDEYLHRHRLSEQARLVAALDSERYKRLTRQWRALLAVPLRADTHTENAARPVVEVASQRIWRAYRRVRRMGKAIEADTPGDALHELRIECKKLRYLMEFFVSLFDDVEIKRLIKALKGLQDNLGDFNDLEVQQHSLQRFAREMSQEGLGSADVFLAMGRLVEHLASLQHGERERFARCFARFDRAANRKRFRTLFAAAATAAPVPAPAPASGSIGSERETACG